MALFEPTARDGKPLSPFREQLAADNAQVFLNPAEFGEARSVRYDGEVYKDVNVVLDEGLEAARNNITLMKTDHSQGLYKGQVRMFCQRKELGGKQPEIGKTLEIESERRNGFWRKYTIEESGCDEGMLTLLLKRVDE